MPTGKGLVASGARVALMLDGKKLFYCYGCNWSEEVVRDPIEPIDQLEVAEHVPLAYRCTFTSQHVRTVGNPVKNLNGVKVMPRLGDILTAGTLTGTVKDRVTNKVLATVKDVEFTRYDTRVANRQIVMTDVTFVCIKITDESEVP